MISGLVLTKNYFGIVSRYCTSSLNNLFKYKVDGAPHREIRPQEVYFNIILLAAIKLLMVTK